MSAVPHGLESCGINTLRVTPSRTQSHRDTETVTALGLL